MNSLDKDSVREPEPKVHHVYARFLWSALGATTALVLMAPVLGIGARLVAEAFTWGWNLLGFAS